MIDRKGAGARALPRVLAAAALVVTLAACDGDAPLDVNGGRALPPDEPSQLLNPLCAGTGGTTHAGGSITTSVTWQASGNPHRVTGTVTLSSGGILWVEPGVIVCFEPQTGLQSYGGRLWAQGTPASRIVLTARDPVLGWYGVYLQGATPYTSGLINVQVEHASLYTTAVVAYGHPLIIDSTVVRQSGGGVRLDGRYSRFRFSRVDTTTNRNIPAVTLGDSARFEESVIRRAAGNGMQIDGAVGVSLIRGRIEGSGGVGLRALHATSFSVARPVRVVGGGSYGIEASPAVLVALYPGLSDQDSLKGNARDTIVVTGGSLNAPMSARAGMPWHVTANIDVGAAGWLRADPGALMVLDPGVGINTHSGGAVWLRGAPFNPVVLTASDPAFGWGGIALDGAPSRASWITNARVEHVAYLQTAVTATGTHRVGMDSVVFRQTGRAVSLLAPGSRLIRSRVDTTLSSSGPAVELGADAILASTLVRGSSGDGVAIHTSTVQVQSCEVRESVGDGIVLNAAAPVANCNLVSNGGVGVRNNTAGVAVVSSNWWGDAAGPFGPNGDGLWGTANYTPFLTAPYVLPYVP